MNRQLKFYFTLLFSLLLLSSCGDHDHNGHSHGDDQSDDHDHEYHRMTVWEENIEWMVKFELHENSGRIEGELYISENSSPVRGATGTLRFVSGGTVESETEIHHEAAGIYHFELFFGDTNTPDLRAEISAGGKTHQIHFGEADRYVGHPHWPAEEVVEFEKNRQWMIDFETGSSSSREMATFVSAIGKAVPDLKHYMEVISPVGGHIDPDDLSIMPVAGERIRRGDIITAISPPLTEENSWVQKRLAFIQAEEVFERAKRLIENNAISQREFQLREREYEARRAGYEHFIGHGENGTTHIIDDNDRLHLTATQNGVVEHIYFTPGRQINSGDVILTHYNPDYLWLELTGYSDELEQLKDLLGVEIQTGRDRTATLNQQSVTLISRDEQSDLTGTKSKVTIAIDNRNRAIKAGQPLQAKLRTGSGDQKIVVPTSAIFDEDSHKVVFVQHSGDQFERRVVRTGSSYDGYIVIEEGISEGERVVTEGVYPLHLVSGNAEIGHGHSH